MPSGHCHHPRRNCLADQGFDFPLPPSAEAEAEPDPTQPRGGPAESQRSARRPLRDLADDMESIAQFAGVGSEEEAPMQRGVLLRNVAAAGCLVSIVKMVVAGCQVCLRLCRLGGSPRLARCFSSGGVAGLRMCFSKQPNRLA